MIDIKQLSFGYNSGKVLFQNLNLQFNPGNIYGLLGKNGAGKTTLLKLMCGLLFPQAGTCTVKELSTGKRRPDFLRDIFLVTEEFYLPPLTIATYKKIYAPFYPGFNHEKFYANLQEFELAPDSVLTTLSYGQKKKFLLAFGLATACTCFVLDEPSNGLDIPSKRQFRRLLAASLEPHRMFIISTHQVRDLENIIDPIIILDQGEIIFAHSIQELSARLSMSLEPASPPDAPDVLYSEKVMGGYAVLRANRTGEESQIDIELLFNAVTANKGKVQEILSKEKIYED